jgi:deoxyadenosine/deoxycytidine kinase
MPLISIDGNVGSGKSTLIEGFKKSGQKYVLVDEPVKEWLEVKDKYGNNALECFYKDQKENAFCFQVLAYITRLSKLMETMKTVDKDTIIITERSIETDRNVFAKMLYEDGLISSIEWETYNYWFNTFKEISKIDYIIYIKTSPEKCLERINKRNRSEESNISIDYLIKCDKFHNDWLESSSTKMITIDGHESIEEIKIKVSSFLIDITN